MDSTKAVAMESGANAIEAALVVGDLSKLTPEHRVVYYHKVCESLGLNPLTKPFQYLVLNGRLTLYATKDCTEQLRDKRKISFIKLEREKLDSLYVVTATAQTADGRVDTSIGAVNATGSEPRVPQKRTRITALCRPGRRRSLRPPTSSPSPRRRMRRPRARDRSG